MHKFLYWCKVIASEAVTLSDQHSAEHCPSCLSHLTRRTVNDQIFIPTCGV